MLQRLRAVTLWTTDEHERDGEEGGRAHKRRQLLSEKRSPSISQGVGDFWVLQESQLSPRLQQSSDVTTGGDAAPAGQIALSAKA
ncbi:unnamed protein product [Pleuronectes platessa]|uniref:Uncharacterized protein n=1 Tax=Pleuronectes platessa TaxID=8262 RepID=A0A9N7UVC8_PLEPL|nr:unnamed protein product [Pleuronectes platessa]